MSFTSGVQIHIFSIILPESAGLSITECTYDLGATLAFYENPTK
jgi:hypothetical protein